MDLLSDPFTSKNSPNKNQSPTKQGPNNASSLLMNQDWKNQQDYKRDIIALELENQKYRNQLYELGQTVNKILDKVKAPSKNYAHTPNLQQQLQLVKKQLHNVNQFIQIYQKQLSVLNNKKKKDQVENLATTQELLKHKADELAQLKKQVRQISHKNKGLQYKLLEYSKKNKIKSVDQQALQLKQLINQNKSLKVKLQQLEQLHSRRQKWLQNNIQSAKQLQKKVQDQQTKLPRIQSRKSIQKQRTLTSLPKLQSQKKIYTKWLQSTSNAKKNDVIQKQLQDLQKINKLVQSKISATSQQIKQIQLQIQKLKQRVEVQQERQNQLNSKQRQQKQEVKYSSRSKQVSQQSSGKFKKKNVGTMVAKKVRKIRKDWVGKFDGLRFSDNRYIRQQSRLYKVLFNTNGYCQFFYYSYKDYKQRFNSKLPFDASNLVNQGKQSTFTVQYPDFIKNIRLKLNIKTHRITQLSLVSNLGIQAQFVVDTNLHTLMPTSKTSQKVTTIVNKQQQVQVNYQMDIKANQAITCLFGSYGVKTDQKKNITHAWLEGLGAQIIEDFVEQLI